MIKRIAINLYQTILFGGLVIGGSILFLILVGVIEGVNL